MAATKYLIICMLGAICSVADWVFAEEPVHAGFLYDDFQLTLAPGRRTEILGPLYFSEQQENQNQWASRRWACRIPEDPVVEYEEYDFLYPVLTYDRFGAEYRWQFFQVFSFAGGKNPGRQRHSPVHAVSDLLFSNVRLTRR